MAVGRVGADDHDHVGLLDRVEVLRAGRGAVGGLQPVAGRRMAHPRAGIDIVVAEGRAHELLHEEGLFVGAARGGDAADGAPAIFRLDALELRGRVVDRLVPGHFAPRIGDLRPDHRLQHAVTVGGVAVGEAALDAGMAAIGLAVLVGQHAHHLLAAHLGLEGAADAAIGASRDHGVLGRPDLDHRFLVQRRSRAGLHAGAAGHAFRLEERPGLARRDERLKAAPGDGQRESALHLLAGPHAARADDAFRGLVGEIGIGSVDARIGVLLAVVTVAHLAQADGAGHVLQLAVAIGRAGEAIERVLRDVELHHALAQPLQPLGLGMHHHAFGDRRGAGGRRPGAALDLDQAKPAGAEGLDHVGRAQLRDLPAELDCRAHDGGAFRHRDRHAVDGERHRLLRFGARGAEVDFVDQRHLRGPHSAASRRFGEAPKSSGKWVSALITG